MAKIGVLLNEVPQAWHQEFLAELRADYGAANVQVLNGVGWSSADPKLLSVAQQLVSWGPDLIVTADTPTGLATVASRTGTIPIVVAHSSDPQSVADLTQPNVGGLQANLTVEAPKRRQMIADLLGSGNYQPIGVIFNGNNDSKVAEFNAIQSAPGANVLPLGVTKSSDIAGAVLTARANGAKSLIVLGDPLTQAHAATIVNLAEHGNPRLPGIYPSRQALLSGAGGLLSYGIERYDQWQKVRAHVDQVAAGAASVWVTTPLALELVLRTGIASLFVGQTIVSQPPATLGGVSVIPLP